MTTSVQETTLLDLIVELQRRGVCNEAELVALVTELLRCGRIRLIGTYGGSMASFT